jgi:UDP-glucose 4-epimerase
MPLEYLSNDIMGTAAVCEFARLHGSKVVYAGSSSAYAGPMLNPYAFAKFTGEQVCEMYYKVYNLSTVTARFFNVYGPRQPTSGAWATVIGIFEKQTQDKTPLTITGTGEQRRDFTHVRDIVDGFIAMSKIEGRSQIINLGTGTNQSINEVADLFGGEKKYLDARPGEAWITLADISETKKILSWEPSIVLKDYISSFLENTKV